MLGPFVTGLALVLTGVVTSEWPYEATGPALSYDDYVEYFTAAEYEIYDGFNGIETKEVRSAISYEDGEQGLVKTETRNGIRVWMTMLSKKKGEFLKTVYQIEDMKSTWDAEQSGFLSNGFVWFDPALTQTYKSRNDKFEISKKDEQIPPVPQYAKFEAKWTNVVLLETCFPSRREDYDLVCFHKPIKTPGGGVRKMYYRKKQ